MFIFYLFIHTLSQLLIMTASFPFIRLTLSTLHVFRLIYKLLTHQNAQYNGHTVLLYIPGVSGICVSFVVQFTERAVRGEK